MQIQHANLRKKLTGKQLARIMKLTDFLMFELK